MLKSLIRTVAWPFVHFAGPPKAAGKQLRVVWVSASHTSSVDLWKCAGGWSWKTVAWTSQIRASSRCIARVTHRLAVALLAQKRSKPSACRTCPTPPHGHRLRALQTFPFTCLEASQAPAWLLLATPQSINQRELVPASQCCRPMDMAIRG